MADFYKGVIPILDDAVPADRDVLFDPAQSFGLVPRDYATDPEPMFAPPGDMVLIEPSEWDARYDEQEAQQSSLEHMYLNGPGGNPAFVNLDQDGHGYCWAYSTGHAIMLDRLKQNLPTVRLNPHSVAAIIKGGADEGGWCGLSAKFVRSNGMAEEGAGPGQWPLHARNLKWDTPELRAAMAKYRIEEDWMDLTRQVYEQRMTAKQLATCGFNNIPCPSDFNWWGHSVCQVRWVRISAGNWGPLILNSWLGWGRHGLAVLQGSKATANGALGIRSTSA